MERPKQLQEFFGSNEIMILNEGIRDIGTNNLGTGTDHIMVLNVPRDVCLEINEQLNIENTGGEPPAFTSPVTGRFISPAFSAYTFPSSQLDGYQQNTNYPGQTSGRAPEISGFHEGCFSNLGTSGETYYSLYAVILQR